MRYILLVLAVAGLVGCSCGTAPPPDLEVNLLPSLRWPAPVQFKQPPNIVPMGYAQVVPAPAQPQYIAVPVAVPQASAAPVAAPCFQQPPTFSPCAP